ncbi:MAG: orotidine 5'-phosphate decarboxylase [Candidatus Roseilinea sp.]|nr:MAG: orotidine 5'-phosphate decarboxylase [Candidatus Roseilinea sp.]
MSAFIEKLAQAQHKNRSYLCIGLDIVVAHTPLPIQPYDEPMLPFARAIIEATSDLVCAYKPNLGFYLAEGAAGMIALERIVRLIPPDIPIILDGTFGDAGRTAEAYARGAFEQFRADAVTLSPYIGSDAIRPFLKYADRGVFVMARTSNAHAWELQDLEVEVRPAMDDRRANALTLRLYEKVALMANRWHAEGPGACGLVVSATAPEEMRRIRALSPQLPFLILSVGAQDSDLAAAVEFGRTRDGLGPVISVSHSVIYASRKADFAEAARAAALQWVEQMRSLGAP